MEWWPLRGIWSQNQRVSRKTYSENSLNSCHYTVCWHSLCWCVILVHINISSVCWHGMADTSCVREVPKPIWPTSWNSGQWGHWSWDLSIRQHRRWSLLHGPLSELLYFCSGVPVYFAQRQQDVLLDNWDHTGTGLVFYTRIHFQNIPPCYHSMLLRIKSQWRWRVGVCERDIYFSCPHVMAKNNRHAQQDVTNNRLENEFCCSILGPYSHYNTPVGKFS